MGALSVSFPTYCLFLFLGAANLSADAQWIALGPAAIVFFIGAGVGYVGSHQQRRLPTIIMSTLIGSLVGAIPGILTRLLLDWLFPAAQLVRLNTVAVIIVFIAWTLAGIASGSLVLRLVSSLGRRMTPKTSNAE
jgi:hypothetical protein